MRCASGEEEWAWGGPQEQGGWKLGVAKDWGSMGSKI